MGKASESLLSGHPEIEVWAAGGAVWRRVDGHVELLLVRRESHKDWTMPKGKLDEGETLRACALREVEEETGLRCVTGDRLSLVTYTDSRGRSKAVVYWTMTVAEGAFVPNREVDAVGQLHDDCRHRHPTCDDWCGQAARTAFDSNAAGQHAMTGVGRDRRHSSRAWRYCTRAESQTLR